MQQPPSELIESMREFAHHLRECTYDGQYSSIKLYRQFLRGNIQEVFNTTFPLLKARLTKAQYYSLIEQFMTLHGAEEPEFHQIASELICFVQKHQLLEDELQKLMEYEWVLYDCEISNAEVPFPNDGSLTPQTEIRVNPTLQNICLPWSLSSLQNICLPWSLSSQGPIWNEHGEYLYGIYRNAQHEVMRKTLDVYDIAVLGLIDERTVIQINDIQKYLTIFSHNLVHDWVICNRANGLVFTE